MRRIDPGEAAQDAAALIDQLQKYATIEVLRHGLILTPAQGEAETASADGQRSRVYAVALDASGNSLAAGLNAVREFVRSEFYGG